MAPLLTAAAFLVFTIYHQVLAGNRDAYANDINECLFKHWPPNVLKGRVPCPGSQLCYSAQGKKATVAQFVVCYNTKTLIPDFTSHVIVGNPSQGGRDDDWHDEIGLVSGSRSSVVLPANDYKIGLQSSLPNYNPDNLIGQFCARGHLTPCSDFSTTEERKETFINTNIAPQWQLFNGGNWGYVEEAVREYNKQQNYKHKLYIFTGTGDLARLPNGKAVMLNNRVYAPKYFWKVVCDPPQATTPPGATSAGQSVVIMAENNIGDISDAKIESKWNSAKKQTKKRGFIQLYSLDEAKKLTNLDLPPLGSDCNPDKRGTFLDSVLDNKLV